VDKGDLTAPTCNDCHGNHGATPPGVESVANVCGQCHGREAELFQKSAKRDSFVAHNELLASADGNCSGCHDNLPESVASIDHFSECVTCHENHGVVRPTVALLGVLPETPCAFCHEGIGAISDELPEPAKKMANYQKHRDELLRLAASAGLKGDERFDWMVEMAQRLPTHVVTGTKPGDRRLRPEFAHLFEKFRIGKTHYSFTDPATGKLKKVSVRRCTDCHRNADSAGRKMAAEMVNRMRELTALTARSERILLGARRGGVEVRSIHGELDAAVDNQIELEVLVHTFNSQAGFEEKYREGVSHAKAALTAGRKSLDELSYRRQGLAAALGLIVLLLFGLAAKIRQLGG
jgi:hypothetical protein